MITMAIRNDRFTWCLRVDDVEVEKAKIIIIFCHNFLERIPRKCFWRAPLGIVPLGNVKTVLSPERSTKKKI